MYPPEAIGALKTALKSIYWFKDDLRLFLVSLDLPAAIVSKQAWHDQKEYKVKIVTKILDELLDMDEEGIGPIRQLVQAVLNIPTFDHLKNLEDGAKKVQDARRNVEALRIIVMEHDDTIKKLVDDREKKKDKAYEAVKRRNEEISELRQRYLSIAVESDHQKRGYLLESFLLQLFIAHDLNPRGSFKNTGEQIDGAFELEGTQFLLEARWRKESQGAEPLLAFSGKVERKLENTLGLFLSIEGFTSDGLEAFGKSRPSIILMDGEDLAIVLQSLIDFRDLLKRKLRHASQTGNPYFKARDCCRS